MKTKEELLDEYDGANQGTKREIVKFLYDNPEQEHDPDSVFESIRGDCPAGTEDTVANSLSALSTGHDRITSEQRSFYHWKGEGRRRPNRRLQRVRRAVFQWLNSLNFSFGTILIAFSLCATGVLCAAVSLVPLFSDVQPLGASFISWFFAAGLLTILGSTAVMAWVPLYLLDIWLAE